MRRSLLLLFVGAVAALVLWYGLRGGAPLKMPAASSTVTSLLPKETLAVFHLPDFNRTRGQWHETEIYKLWREPAVQDFLQKPLARMPKTGAVREKLQQLETLGIKDAFLAVTSWEENAPKIVAGFRFKGSADDAEKVIGQWRAQALQRRPAAKHEAMDHEKHHIETMTDDAMTIATVYDGEWFFAANDMAALKMLLDRADGRVKDSASTLAANEDFTASRKHLPASYAAFGYARLDKYFEKLIARLPQDGDANSQAALLRQVRSISATTSFEKGKVRDVLFVAMPRVEEAGELNRNSLSLATKNSFLYVASVLVWPQQMILPDPQAITAGGAPAGLQRLVAAFGANGITLEEWNSAFGQEIGFVGDWPENARLPALFATLPVKDAAKANKIAATITTAAGGEGWSTSEKEGVQYYTQAPANPLIPIAPTAGISNQLLVAGLDQSSVEAAIKRTGSRSELAAAKIYKEAERSVPAPTQSFTYLDSALLYSRLDAAFRPMLVMAAAFMPSLAEQVELGKLPAAEVITRHLSPVAVSQRYQNDGYVSESIGPVSIYQAFLGIAAASGAGAAFYQHQMRNAGGPGNSFLPPTQPTITPAVSSPSPGDSP